MLEIVREIPEKILEKLKVSKIYRGQIRSVVKNNGREASIYNKKTEAIKLLEEFYFPDSPPSLYIHQGEALKYLYEGKNVVLSMVPGSGKKEVSVLYSLIFLHSEGGKVIYISDFIESARKFYKNICEKKDKAHFPFFEISFVDDVEKIYTLLSSNPDILIIPRSFLKDIIDAMEDKSFVEKSLLFIIDGLEEFHPEELYLLKEFILKTDPYALSDKKFLILTDLIGSPERLVESVIVGENFEYMTTEGSPKSAYYMMSWFPPFEVEIGEKPVVKKRRDYYSELTDALIHILEEEQKVLIWHAFAPLGSRKLRRIKEEISRKRPDLKLDINFFITDNPKAVSSFYNRDFDIVVLLGLPKNISRMFLTLGNILKEEGIAILIQPEEPFSFLCINNPRYLEKFYFQRPECIPSFLLLTDEPQWIAKLDQKEILRLPEGYYPLKIYEGAILNFGDKEYKIGRVDETKKEIQLTPCSDTDWILTLPVYDVKISEGKREILKQNKIGEISFSLNKVSLGISVSGYKFFSDFVFPEREKVNKNIVRFQSPLKKSFSDINVIIIENLPDSHIFKHFFKIYFDHRYLYWENLIQIDILDEHSLIIFPLIEKFSMDMLFQDLPSILSNEEGSLPWLSLSILFECPCTQGCPNCVHILNCNKESMVKEDKKIEAIRFLGEFLGRKDIEDEIKFLTKGFEDEAKAKGYYDKLVNPILGLLNQKFSLTIKEGERVPLKVKHTSEMGEAIGIYDGSSVIIAYPLPKAESMAVIAHEYTHHWQRSGKEVLGNYDEKVGKLLTEGFAEWITFKVCEYFGLDEKMEDILSIPELSHYNITRFLKLEEIGGYYGVIDFYLNGKTIHPDTGETIDVNYFKEKLI